MNAIVEFPHGELTKVYDPELVVLAQKGAIAELKREVRALKKEIKDERRHTVDMLAIMRDMGEHRASAILPRCNCEACTCTPTRAEMLSRR